MGMEDAVLAQQLSVQQNISLAVIKQAADMQQQVVALLADSIATVPVSGSLGTAVNLTA